jgi:hypothetical protein
MLTLKKGDNRLEFSWANTLIDPTSLEMIPMASADKIDILDLVYPARTRNVGVWRLHGDVAGEVPMEITYLTSGLSWRAFYMGTLSPDEKTMRLQGYVRVSNQSGEEYENAQVRLIVGKVHIIDRIMELAQREFPYGRPQPEAFSGRGSGYADTARIKNRIMAMDEVVRFEAEAPQAAPREIKKEGLSEYFLYTIEGKETIPNGWSKRLPSFETDGIPVINLYKYDERRYGSSVIRFLSFKNNKEHKLGKTPIPGGMLRVFRALNARDPAPPLSYEGASAFKYIPVDQDVELNLGVVQDVTVQVKMMHYETDHYIFDRHGNVSGWDEKKTFEIEVKNTRNIPVKIEIQRSCRAAKWEIRNSGDFGDFEQIDKDTVKYTLEPAPGTKRTFRYVLTLHHGERAD